MKGGENMTKKITISVPLDKEVLDELTTLQSKYAVFSRSQLLRDLIEKGLKVLEKQKAKQK